ncbi:MULTISPECIES: Hsp20/alpha crystallin family protein [Phenylobacterium]|uniref:HSP20 family protein n=1 Tax=Phenylobacterium koreense TaxID=266125 RepID=A0ABV2EI55_9CAUL
MPNRDLAPWSGSRGLSRQGWDPFTSFRREMDRLFDDFLTPAEGRSFAPTREGAAAWPSIEVDENDQAYRVTAELAGLNRDDVKIELRDNALTLSGERRDERTEEDKGRCYTERTYGKFARTIPFSHEIDGDRVEANFKDGVLKIALPKSTRAQDQTRQIEIKS